MTVIEVGSVAELDRLLGEHTGPVVVDFAAESWCAPCRRLRPHYDKVAEFMPAVTFVRADLDEGPDLASAYDIVHVPTITLFNKGERIDIASMTAPALVREITEKLSNQTTGE